MLLLIDNYDSFTYNLVQRIGELDSALDVHVVRNDKITLDEAVALDPTHLLISPGPGTPKETGVCGKLIDRFKGEIPILGVCLGHQAIADRNGGQVVRHHTIMHGKTSMIHHDEKGIFEGLSNPFVATRYHSLIVQRDTIDESFEVCAWTEQKEVMGLRLKPAPGRAPLDGVQFHPESFLTTEGPLMLANFLGLPRPVRAPKNELGV
jgi:anthranilate synthase/aminodeoxychorismate synthase-like glutamine amidotransferase